MSDSKASSTSSSNKIVLEESDTRDLRSGECDS